MKKKQNLDVHVNKFKEKVAKDTTPIKALDLGEAMLSGFKENLQLCLEDGIKQRHGDFFIVVLRKREALINRIVRNIFLHRLTCPTPNYDQIVYHYNKKEDKLLEIWIIPDRESCYLLKENALEASFNEKELLKYVLDFADGTLAKVMQRLNGEKNFSLELEPEKIKELRK